MRFFKTDKEISISLCVVKKALKEIGHTQEKTVSSSEWLKKIGVVHLIKFYGGEGRKYLE